MVDEFQYIDQQRGKASAMFVQICTCTTISHFLLRFWGRKERLDFLISRVVGSPLKTKRNR